MRSTNDEGEETPEIEWEVPDTLMEDLSAEQRRQMVDSVLHRLPDHQRIPLVLYHFEELSYQEIAAKLQISLSRVKSDIFRARAALLPLLQATPALRDSLDA
jgi:RNA polymerase sigma-70 factor (ECF subfamily)